MRLLQPAETTSNVHISIDAEEVSGSNPLSPTLRKVPICRMDVYSKRRPRIHSGAFVQQPCSNAEKGAF